MNLLARISEMEVDLIPVEKKGFLVKYDCNVMNSIGMFLIFNAATNKFHQKSQLTVKEMKSIQLKMYTYKFDALQNLDTCLIQKLKELRSFIAYDREQAKL
jgi:hypothetical protein